MDAAEGRPLEGGSHVVQLNLGFRQRFDGVFLEEKFQATGEFYEADIQVDVILSYAWLYEKELFVAPHHSALAREVEEGLVFLLGKPTGKERK